MDALAPWLVSIVVALLGGAALLVQRWLGRRAVITAEQRGRADAIDEQRAAEHAKAQALDAVVRDLAAQGEASAQAAEASTTADPVTRAEVNVWIKPKGES